MKLRRSIMALLLALALLPLWGLAEDLGDDGVLAGEDAAAPEELPGEAGALGPAGDEAAPTPGATAKPREKSEKIPYYTSYNYPKDKISFENEIWAILTGKWGLEDYQAAGLMSSIQAESGFCPYNAEDRGGADDRGRYEYRVDDSVGFGLGQWGSAGRKAALLRHAEAHGSAELVWDFDIQMGFMGGEIDMASLKSTHNLYEAAEWAVMFYERPDQRYANSWPGTRYERGKALYRAHTGREYDEPEPRFAARLGDGTEVPDGGVVLPATGAPGEMRVRSNYYWRLEVADETEAGWLAVEAPSFYFPDRTEPCAYGYVCDGDKPLTLVVAKLPPLGQTYRATLRFELWNGGHESVEIPVRATCTLRDIPVVLGQADLGAAAVGVGASMIAAGML